MGSVLRARFASRGSVLACVTAAALLWSGVVMGTPTKTLPQSQSPDTSSDNNHSPGAAAGTLPGAVPKGDTTMVGLDVEASHHVKVGKVYNLIVSPNGKVQKVVILLDGVLNSNIVGGAGKQVPVDWSKVKVDNAHRLLLVSMPPSQIQSATGYPNRTTLPSGENLPAPGGVALIGLEAVTSDHKDNGKIRDAVVTPAGAIQGAIISVDQESGVGNKQVDIDWSKLRVDPSQKKVALSLTGDQLKSAPSFQTIRPAPSAAAPRGP